MTVSLSSAKKLARTLLVLNGKLSMSWREIAFHVYNDKVNFATLNRIAKSKGKWLPKNEDILKTLGLIKPRNPFVILPKWFDRSDQALEWFKAKRQTIKEMSQESRMSLKKAKGYK